MFEIRSIPLPGRAGPWGEGKGEGVKIVRRKFSDVSR